MNFKISKLYLNITVIDKDTDPPLKIYQPLKTRIYISSSQRFDGLKLHLVSRRNLFTHCFIYKYYVSNGSPTVSLVP